MKNDKPIRRLATNLLISLCTFLLLFGIGEAGLRLFYPPPYFVNHHRVPDPVLGWRLNPGASVLNARIDYRVRVKVNSQGLRDIEHDYEKPEGTYRIAVLGDSYMEAYSVPLDKMFARLLDDQIGTGTEVINLGVGGYGTLQEYLIYEKEGEKYDPDLVLVAFFAENDVLNNSAVLTRTQRGEDDERFYSQPFLDPSADWNILAPDYERAAHERMLADSAPIWKRTAIYKSFEHTLTRPNLSDPHIWEGIYLCEETADYTEAWDVTEKILIQLDQTTRENGAQLVVFTVPAQEEVVPDYQQEVLSSIDTPDDFCIEEVYSNERLIAILDQHNIPYVDLLPVFREATREGNQQLYHRFDGHWNAAGHELAAQSVYEALEDQQLLPSDPGQSQ